MLDSFGDECCSQCLGITPKTNVLASLKGRNRPAFAGKKLLCLIFSLITGGKQPRAAPWVPAQPNCPYNLASTSAKILVSVDLRLLVNEL